MNESPLPMRAPEHAEQTSGQPGYSAMATIGKSVLATAVVTACILGAIYAGSGALPFLPHENGDIVSDGLKRERLDAYQALGPVNLMGIADANVVAALDSMQLSAEAKQSLQTDIRETAQQATEQLKQAAPAPPTTTPVQQATAVSDRPKFAAAETKPVALIPDAGAVSAKPKTTALKLAWITLWDTDKEDGDVVRIDSQGYSRVVVLSKMPVTLAIPIPSNGVINVTGMKDGEGGGITVGLASGASKAVFPIMSVGQMLGLNVAVN